VRHAARLDPGCTRTTGTPNTAITASPMNFSTEPSCRSTIAFIRSKVAREQRPQRLRITDGCLTFLPNLRAHVAK
jgi:hypothetical protein